MKPFILGLILISTSVSLMAQPPDATDWRVRLMELPGLTLAISSDKTAIKKDETVELSIKLQYLGNDRVLIEKPDSNKLLWLFHPEVKVPLPPSIPFVRTAVPTPEGIRLLRSAEPFTKKSAFIHDYADTCSRHQKPGYSRDVPMGTKHCKGTGRVI